MVGSINANELADELAKVENRNTLTYATYIADAQTMLRQLQAENEALKAELRGIDELITGKAQEK